MRVFESTTIAWVEDYVSGMKTMNAAEILPMFPCWGLGHGRLRPGWNRFVVTADERGLLFAGVELVWTHGLRALAWLGKMRIMRINV